MRGGTLDFRRIQPARQFESLISASSAGTHATLDSRAERIQCEQYNGLGDAIRQGAPRMNQAGILCAPLSSGVMIFTLAVVLARLRTAYAEPTKAVYQSFLINGASHL